MPRKFDSIADFYSGFTDKKGLPICDNDLIKVFHFKTRSGKAFYMYKRALKMFNSYYLVANDELGIRPLLECHKLLIDKYLDFSLFEVIQ